MNIDVTIVGAGLVGCTLACLLSNQGLRVGIVDRNNPLNVSKESELQGRTVALNLSSVGIFQDLDLWNDIYHSTTNFNRIYVWDSTGSSPLEFLSEHVNEENLGYVASNNLILSFLSRYIHRSKSIELYLDSEISSLEIDDNKTTILLSDGKQVSSPLVVGADGAKSFIRNKINIDTRTWSYYQKAFVASLKTNKPHLNTAWQVFTSTGPIALLPYDKAGKANVSLVWSADNKYAAEINKFTKKDFSRELEEKTESILGNVEIVGDIYSFPLYQLHSKTYFSNRAVLVGDAAHSFHPLAGQGLNSGLSDVSCLFKLIAEYRRKAKDIGSKEILRDYEKRRKVPNLAMVALMELFKQGFEGNNPWLKLTRNMAFKVASKNRILKRNLIKQAAGIT